MRSILYIVTLFVCVVALECTADPAEKSSTPTSDVVDPNHGAREKGEAGSEHANLSSDAERKGNNGQANGSSGSGVVHHSNSAPTDSLAKSSASDRLDSEKDTPSSDGSQPTVVIPALVSAPTSAPADVGTDPIGDKPAKIAKGDSSDSANTGKGGDPHNPSVGSLGPASSAATLPVKLDRTDENPSTVDDRSEHDGDDDLDRTGSPPTDGGHKTGSSASDGRLEAPPEPDLTLSGQPKHSSGGDAADASRASGSINRATDSGTGISTGSGHASAGQSKLGSSPSAPTTVVPGGSSAGNGSGVPTLQAKGQQEKQTKILNSQIPGNGDGLQTYSRKPLPDAQLQKNKVPTPSTPHEKKEEDLGASRTLQQKGDNTIKMQVTHDQGNAGTLKDTKAGTSVSPNKGAQNAPKAKPAVTTGTKQPIDSTTMTTQMADDVQYTKVVHNTSTAPTIPLNKLSKAAQQLQSLDNKDSSSSSSSLLLAFATFFTIVSSALAQAC